MNTCARALVSLSSVCFKIQPSMQTALSQAGLPAARRQSQWRAAFGSSASRRGSVGSLLGNALGGRSALPAMQRQQQRRLAAAAAGTAAEPEAAAAPSQQRRELPKNFDPAASEEALYQWWVLRRRRMACCAGFPCCASSGLSAAAGTAPGAAACLPACLQVGQQRLLQAR